MTMHGNENQVSTRPTLRPGGGGGRGFVSGRPPLQGGVAVLATLALALGTAAAQPLDLPVDDDFETPGLDPAIWGPTSGFVSLSTNGVNEPSPAVSVNFKGIGTLQSQPMDAFQLFANFGPVGTVSFWSQHRGVEAGKTLVIDYKNSAGNWVPLGTLTSNGVTQSNFEFNQFALPTTAYHENLVIRFTANGTQLNDDWFIDNVRVGPFGGNAVPWFDDFETGLGFGVQWGVVFNADIATGVGNEPSGASVLRMNSNDRMESVNQLMGVASVVDQQFYLRFWVRESGVEAGEVLRVEYFDPDANDDGVFDDEVYRLLDEIVATGVSRPCFQARQYTIPIEDNTDTFRVRLTAVGDEANDNWFIDDLVLSPVAITTDGDCRSADFAAPCGSLTFADINQFLAWFNGSDPRANLVAPSNLTFADITAFLSGFSGGCSEPYGN